jgi:2-hydroxy-3-keto-5-methylthiopentenyl-1-phosphate phosphatase
MAFACVYMLTQQVAPAVPKLREKKELETVFRSFWNNINQQMMDYRMFSEGLNLLVKNLLKKIKIIILTYIHNRKVSKNIY